MFQLFLIICGLIVAAIVIVKIKRDSSISNKVTETEQKVVIAFEKVSDDIKKL